MGQLLVQKEPRMDLDQSHRGKNIEVQYTDKYLQTIPYDIMKYQAEVAELLMTITFSKTSSQLYSLCQSQLPFNPIQLSTTYRAQGSLTLFYQTSNACSKL